MSNLVQVAEQMVNFLLTRKQEQKKKNAFDSKRKSKEKDEELNEIIFLSEQPSVLKNGFLRDHQLVGLNWLISLNQLGVNGILADEMGLGKTIQTIALIGYLYQFKNLRGPHLIVCPNSVVSNWAREFKKWLPQIKVIKLIARKEYRYDIINDYIKPRKFDVIVTSYEGINICGKALKNIYWQYIIVDEAHRIKNHLSLLSINLRLLKTRLKLLITGTPLQNNLKELWALLNFIMPDLFSDEEVFEDY